MKAQKLCVETFKNAAQFHLFIYLFAEHFASLHLFKGGLTQARLMSVKG